MKNDCFHCGETIPDKLELKIKINNQLQGFCCLGCKAVTEQIIEFGFSDYYKHRTQFPKKPELLVPDVLKEFTIFNNPQIQSEFVNKNDRSSKEARLIIEGITCPACTWLIESHLSALPAIQDVNVNYSTQRCRVSWQDNKISLSEILSNIVKLGYKAFPYNAKQREQVYENERKTYLLRLGIAGLFGMQVMMIAIALYFGEASGIDERYKIFFQWISLLLTLPVLLYSGQPVFAAAIRDIRIKHPGMNIPITLGITIAFISSLFATIQQSGHIYYDSIVMFLFFVLGGRYFEFTSRKKSIAQLDKISSLLPLYATKILNDGNTETILLDRIKVSDKILVRPGEVIPIDGIVYEGSSTVNESIITGESMPINKKIGMHVVGGSTNVESPLYIEVEFIGEKTFLSNISRIIEKAANNKTSTLLLANKIVSLFIITLLTLASLVAVYWYFNDTERWLEITISVLVVSCPCALSLATPTALSSALATLIKYGIAIINNDAIERLGQSDCFIFDKTGTLTEGILELDHIDIIDHNYSKETVITIAAALENASEHPVAKAICKFNSSDKFVHVTQTKNYPGLGISGKINNETWQIGTKEFIEQYNSTTRLDADADNSFLRRIILANDKNVIAYFYFSDHLRLASRDVIQSLKQSGKKIILMSGDHESIVKQIANKLDIDEYASALKPDGKLNHVAKLQKQGYSVCMIGDGVNDAPAFAKADVAIAMTNASDITKLNANILLLNNKIESIKTMLEIVTKTNRTVRLNFRWAITYNLIALPFAMTGYLSPWMAALGMSLSSLIVVLNATRISSKDYT